MRVGTRPLCHVTPDIGQIYGFDSCQVSFEVRENGSSNDQQPIKTQASVWLMGLGNCRENRNR